MFFYIDFPFRRNFCVFSAFLFVSQGSFPWMEALRMGCLAQHATTQLGEVCVKSILSEPERFAVKIARRAVLRCQTVCNEVASSQLGEVGVGRV